MKNHERKMLFDLYESVKGLYAFTFYTRYSIDPEKMFEFITKYQDRQIISYSNEVLTLTESGKKYVLGLVDSEWTTAKDIFANIPVDFLGDKIEINSPYLPNIKDVSVEILDKKKVE